MSSSALLPVSVILRDGEGGRGRIRRVRTQSHEKGLRRSGERSAAEGEEEGRSPPIAVAIVLARNKSKKWLASRNFESSQSVLHPSSWLVLADGVTVTMTAYRLFLRVHDG